MDIARKFRVMADIIQSVRSGYVTIEEICNNTCSSGILRSPEVEALTMLAEEFGFISQNNDKFSVTKGGTSFEKYISYVDTEQIAEGKFPPLEFGNGSKICVTVPPRLMKQIELEFGDNIVDTWSGLKMVVEDCVEKLIIVSPFIDVPLLQLAISKIYSKNTNISIITSDPSFINRDGRESPWVKKLEMTIKNRFGSGSVFFLEEEATIAHAKVWCCEKSAFITSANIKSNSTTENLEIGIFVDEPELIKTLWLFLEFILSEGKLKCILRV